MTTTETVRQIERDMIAVCQMDKLVSSGAINRLSAQDKMDPEFQRIFKMWHSATGGKV